jgi:phage gp29-like protein
MAKRVQTRKPPKLPEYGEIIRTMESEVTSILTDYYRQYIGVVSDRTQTPGTGIFINFDPVLNTQSYKQWAWYPLYKQVETDDPQILAVMQSAKIAVALLGWDVDAFKNEGEDEPSEENKKVAGLVKYVFENIPNLHLQFFNLMGALGMGFAVSEVIWGKGKYDRREILLVENMLNREQRRFQFDAVTREPKLRDINNPYMGIDLPPYKILVHRVSATWDNPFGDALDQTLYWMWLFKKTVVKFSLQHLEVGSASIPYVRHPQGASPELKAEALAIAQQVRTGAYGRVPSNFEILFAEAKNVIQNADAFDKALRRFDEQISKAVEGQTLTTDTGDSGTRAQGQVHENTKSSRTVFRARGLQETLNTLVKWIVDINVGEVEGYPKFRFDLEDPADLVQEAQIINSLSSAGYDFDEQELSDKFNYTLKRKQPLQLEPKKPTNEPEPVEE